MKTLNLFLLITAITMISACKPQKNNDTPTVSNIPLLKDTINYTTAARLVNNFESRANHVKKGELLFNDTRCVWFSLTQLKALVTRIEKENGDGIRFYSAAYDKEKRPDMKKLDSTYLDYSTLVMVSTYYSKGIHLDYYNTKDSNGRATNKGAIIMAIPENQGELCPPPKKCNTVGATLLN